MAAVAHASPALLRPFALVPNGSVARVRPDRTPAAVFRRRRLVAMAVGVVVTFVVLTLGGFLASSGTDAPSAAGHTTISGQTYVVQPGDTLWAIARRLEPVGDPRPLVARLVAAHGSPVLVAGERLTLPAPA